MDGITSTTAYKHNTDKHIMPKLKLVPTANAAKLTTLSKKTQLMLLSERAKTVSKEAAEMKEKEAKEEKKKKQAEINKR